MLRIAQPDIFSHANKFISVILREVFNKLLFLKDFDRCSNYKCQDHIEMHLLQIKV